MNRSDIEDKVLSTLAALLSMPRGELGPCSDRDSLAAWDSLKHMHLVLALEDLFDVEFDDDEIASLASASELTEAVVGKVAA